MEHDLFLKIAGITGPSTDREHEGEVEATNFNHGMNQSARPVPQDEFQANEPPRCYHQELSVGKTVDQTSIALAERCASGEPISEVVVTAYMPREEGNPGPRTHCMTIRLTDVIVSGINLGGGFNSELNENVSFCYRKIDWQQGTANPTHGSVEILPPKPTA